MQDLSLNILDIADNSIKAEASLIEIEVIAEGNLLTIRIKDDGCGMSEEFAAKAADPYVTTRKTRNVGLGLPFFKMESEISGGKFSIKSEKGKGTTVEATFVIDNIDRPPLGDLPETALALLPACTKCDLVLKFVYGGKEFTFDTRELKERLDGTAIDEPYVMQFVKDLIQENITSILGGVIL
jgi:hypothetical protein